MNTIFTIHDYWGNEVNGISKILEMIFIIELKSHSKVGFTEYNKCFTNKSMIARHLSRFPISSVVNGDTFVVSTNCPLFHYIIMNKENIQQLKDLGLIDENASLQNLSFFVYSKILRSYFQPLPIIQEEVERRLANTTGKYIIGMHIRCGNPMADFKDQSSFLNVKDIVTFNKCVKREAIRPDSVIVVASDSTKAKLMIQNYNPYKEVYYDNSKSQHTMTRYFNKMRLSSLQSSFSEMIMLSKANVLVGTARSTFSLTAGAFKGEIPYLVTTGIKSCSIPKVVSY